MFYNPFDISKDGKEPFIDGLRFHIRKSAELVETIKNFMLKYYTADEGQSARQIYLEVINYMNIDEDDLTIIDEKELVEWIGRKFVK